MRDALIHWVYSPASTLGAWVAYRMLARAARAAHELVPGYAVVISQRLSRSAQPSPDGFRWLREQGVRTVVNLRWLHDDRRLLARLGFGGYLHLPVREGLAPTEQQAEAFLAFVRDPSHWPVHVHCRTGVRRTGCFVALAHYALDGWPMDEALAEARAVFPGPSHRQVAWLQAWATEHPPGEPG